MDEQTAVAIKLLKQAKAVSESVPGGNLDLTKPPQSAWSAPDFGWLDLVKLHAAAEHYNNTDFGSDTKKIQPRLVKDRFRDPEGE